jgi:F-type H+-transporting ATPase subunit delta
MLHTRTTRRFAKVVFHLAKNTGRLADVQRDFAGLRDLLRQLPDLSAFLANYMVPAEQRLDVLKSIFESRLSELTFKFVMFLEEQKQLRLPGPVTDAFGELCDQESGMLKATITSARPLNDEQLAALRQKLEGKFKQHVAVESAINPVLLGGFEIQIGDTIYNSSTAHQLEMFKQKIITA